MLLIFIILGILYALPNLYGEYLAVKITGLHGFAVNDDSMIRLNEVLKKNNIPVKYMTIKDNAIIANFESTEIQLLASEVLTGVMGDKYLVALHLANATPHWLTAINAAPMKLGLDLRGGVQLLIEVDVETAIEKLQEKNIYILQNYLNDKGIPYKEVSVRNENNYGNCISITFNDSATLDKAIDYLTLINTDLLYLKNGKKQLYAILSDARIKDMREYAVQQNINILRKRINKLGIVESLVQRQGTDRILIDIPGIQNTELAKDIIGATASLEFHIVNTNINMNKSVEVYGIVPEDSELKYTSEGKPIVLYKRVILTGEHITNSTYSLDEYNQPQVNIYLDSAGGKILYNFTKDNIGKLMATLFVEYKDSGKKDANGRAVLVKNEEIINIANIHSRFGNRFRITGINSAEARKLSLLLRAGALIAPINIVEVRSIGPYLGIHNIKRGIEACLVAILFSIIFLICVYKKFGIIAITALIINLVLIVGMMSIIPGATLTMSGIAGIVLTLAVAVDANILINERIKEELSNGRSVQHAIDEGYRRAFSSMFDANITTLIKVIILYAIGTGAIEAFAITTGIGVATSMFTSIVGTRAIVNLLYGGKQVKKLSI